MSTTDGPTNATRDDGTRYYRGGCAAGMPLRGACHTGCLHRASVTEYRAWRAAWEDGQGSDTTAPTSVAGAAGSLLANHQLEDDAYREAYPPPTFRAWLEGRRGHDQEEQ